MTSNHGLFDYVSFLQDTPESDSRPEPLMFNPVVRGDLSVSPRTVSASVCGSVRVKNALNPVEERIPVSLSAGATAVIGFEGYPS